MNCTFGSTSKRYFYLFSSGSVIIVDFTPRLLIHVKLIFVCSVKHKLKFLKILSCVYPVFPAPFFLKLAFIHCIVSIICKESVVQEYVSYILDSVLFCCQLYQSVCLSLCVSVITLCSSQEHSFTGLLTSHGVALPFYSFSELC